MIVIPHDAVGVAEPGVSLYGSIKDFQEFLAVAILQEDMIPGIPPACGMIHGPMVLNS